MGVRTWRLLLLTKTRVKWSRNQTFIGVSVIANDSKSNPANTTKSPQQFCYRIGFQLSMFGLIVPRAGTGGRSICDPCIAGRFSAQAGLSACLSCPAGRAQSRAASNACDECTVGRYAQQTGRRVFMRMVAHDGQSGFQTPSIPLQWCNTKSQSRAQISGVGHRKAQKVRNQIPWNPLKSVQTQVQQLQRSNMHLMQHHSCACVVAPLSATVEKRWRQKLSLSPF